MYVYLNCYAVYPNFFANYIIIECNSHTFILYPTPYWFLLQNWGCVQSPNGSPLYTLSTLIGAANTWNIYIEAIVSKAIQYWNEWMNKMKRNYIWENMLNIFAYGIARQYGKKTCLNLPITFFLFLYVHWRVAQSNGVDILQIKT